MAKEMERANQVGSCSSSSFTMELFGPKDSLRSSSSSTGLLETIFGPPTFSMVPARDTRRPDTYAYAKQVTSADYNTQKGNPLKKDKYNTEYENGKIEPSYFNSSIYYGGQEIYSATTWSTSPPHNFKKDRGEVDPNESNSSCASRGNWWKGSLYY